MVSAVSSSATRSRTKMISACGSWWRAIRLSACFRANLAQWALSQSVFRMRGIAAVRMSMGLPTKGGGRCATVGYKLCKVNVLDNARRAVPLSLDSYSVFAG